MLVSFIIPVYNEASHLFDFLKKIDEIQLSIDKELVIINDCSKDDSKSIITSFPFKSKYQLVDKPKNEGKGAALRSGIEVAKGDIIAIQDADFEYDIDDIHALLVPLIADKADVVYGSRFKKSANQVHRTLHYLINRFLTLVSNVFSGLYLTDMETCYKFFRADIIKNCILESNRFGFEPEVTAKLARIRVRIHELPINYFPRTYLEGKKITWKDGIAALWHLFVFNFNRNLKSSFRDDLPKRYLPRDGHWL